MASRNYDQAFAAINGSGGLRGKCEMFLLLDVVPAILAEAADAPDHANRLAWAEALERDDGFRARVALRLAVKSVENPSILASIAAGSGIDDGDIQYVGLQQVDYLVSLGGY